MLPVTFAKHLRVSNPTGAIRSDHQHFQLTTMSVGFVDHDQGKPSGHVACRLIELHRGIISTSGYVKVRPSLNICTAQQLPLNITLHSVTARRKGCPKDDNHAIAAAQLRIAYVSIVIEKTVAIDGEACGCIGVGRVVHEPTVIIDIVDIVARAEGAARVDLDIEARRRGAGAVQRRQCRCSDDRCG